MEWLAVVPDVLDDMPSPGSWMNWAEIYDHPPFTKPADEYANIRKTFSNGNRNQDDEEGYDCDSDLYSKESILYEFETITSQMTEDTRICFCDALYRLARKSEQYTTVEQRQTADYPSTSSSQEGIHDETMRSIHRKRALDDSSDLIDLTVADLLFLNQEEHCSSTSLDNQQQTLNIISQQAGARTYAPPANAHPGISTLISQIRQYPELNDFQVPELSY